MKYRQNNFEYDWYLCILNFEKLIGANHFNWSLILVNHYINNTLVFIFRIELFDLTLMIIQKSNYIGSN